jgi:hypothetical protein
MKYPHSIPLWRAGGEPLPGNAPYRIVLSSVGTKCTDVVVEQRHVPSSERPDVMYKRHVIAINIGHSITGSSRKRDGFSASSRQEARFPSSRAIGLFLVG